LKSENLAKQSGYMEKQKGKLKTQLIKVK